METTFEGHFVSPGFSASSEDICTRFLCLSRRSAGSVCHKVMRGGLGEAGAEFHQFFYFILPQPCWAVSSPRTKPTTPQTPVRNSPHKLRSFSQCSPLYFSILVGLVGLGQQGGEDNAFILVQHLGLNWSYSGYDQWTGSISLTWGLVRKCRILGLTLHLQIQNLCLNSSPQVIPMHIKV